MNNTSVQTTAASLVALVAGFAAGHGWLGLSLSDWTTVLTALASVGAIVWPLFSTRSQALKNTVGHMDKTTVVTDPDSANALPNNPDVVAATPAIVAEINKAKAQGA